MPTHDPARRDAALEAALEAAEARIDALLAELRSPADPELLDRIRALFRRRVPLGLRAYAAAALIAGAPPPRGAPAGRGSRRERGGGQAAEGRREAALRAGDRLPPAASGASKPRSKGEAGGEAKAAPPADRPRLRGESLTLFFGMGKRQRFYPRVLYAALTEEGGLAPEEIGDIRAFDNYCFADVAPARAEAVLAALAGFEFRGRVLPGGLARQRGDKGPESVEEAELAEEAPGGEAEGVVDEDGEDQTEAR